MFGGAGGPFGGDMGQVFAQLQRLMSWSGGPVNWDLATEVATGATRADDRPVTAEEVREVEEACRLADLWLDPVTTLPAGGAAAQAWTRTGWVESTLPAWRALVDPVAGRVVEAMGTAMGTALGGGLPEGVPPELAGMLGGGAGLKGVMEQVGGFVFGAQVGQALGALAGGVLSASEVGLPLSTPGRPALLPANVAAFADGLEVPADQVRLYLALREVAHQRLFASVPWLKAHLFDAVDAYARGIEVDPSAIERAVGSIDPSDPESMQRAMGDGLFALEPTPAQAAALARLETALALVEGWVDAVVDAAAPATLPAGRRAARDRPPPPRLGRSGRADLRDPRRAAAAAAPAARGGRAVGRGRRAGRTRPPATRCGRTRTCCRPPTTWTTRPASWPAPAVRRPTGTPACATSTRTSTAGWTTTPPARSRTTRTPAAGSSRPAGGTRADGTRRGPTSRLHTARSDVRAGQTGVRTEACGAVRTAAARAVHRDTREGSPPRPQRRPQAVGDGPLTAPGGARSVLQHGAPRALRPRPQGEGGRVRCSGGSVVRAGCS